MCCGRCGLQWDLDDDDRPQCLTDDEIIEVIPPEPEPDRKAAAEAVKQMRQTLTPEKKD